jgi:hypothetical protein
MTRPSDDETLRFLREVLAAPAIEPPAADLWPRVIDRIERGSRPATAADWILLTLVAMLCLLQPSAIRVLLFHF